MGQGLELKNILNNLKFYENCTLEYYTNGKKYRKTYGEMYNEVLKTITYLRNCEIKQGQRIGIIAENCYEWILIDLACVVGGYITVPFHSTTYEGELENIFEKYDLKMIFADKKIVDKLSDYKFVIDIHTIMEKIEDKSECNDNYAKLGSEDIFTIVFTSGTTSIPKAIELKVKSFDDFIINAHKMFSFNNEDKVIMFLPLSHFGQRSYVYGAILSGFNMVMTQPENIIKVLRVDKPSILVAVPYFFENIHKLFYKNIKTSKKKHILYKLIINTSKLISKDLKKKIQHKYFKMFHDFWGGKMRIMVTGSAPISKDTLKFYDDMGITLYEGYGTNETGLVALNYPGNSRLGSVGKMFPNKQIKLDKEGQILVSSEFCWAERYLGTSDEKNKEVFCDDGYIKTGDVGYFDKDGFLYIKGRIKETIVLSNGKKVYPNLIEDELNKSSLIKQSAVFGDNRSFLVAVIVQNDQQINKESIMKEIQKINNKFPEYAKIKDFIIAQEPFQVENNMLTSSLKLSRSYIYEFYEKLLKDLY